MIIKVIVHDWWLIKVKQDHECIPNDDDDGDGDDDGDDDDDDDDSDDDDDDDDDDDGDDDDDDDDDDTLSHGLRSVGGNLSGHFCSACAHTNPIPARKSEHLFAITRLPALEPNVSFGDQQVTKELGRLHDTK